MIIFVAIAVIFISFVLFFSNKKNKNNKVVAPVIITKPEFVPRKILVCEGLNCAKDNFKNCTQSQFFENEKDVVNSKGVAVFGEFNSKCSVIFSYNLKNNIECHFDKTSLTEDNFNKLWLGSISKIDVALKDYCKVVK